MMHQFNHATGSRKLFLLVLDSTPITFLKENASALPNIGTLLRSAIQLETKSPADFFSAAPWPTFASGRMPGDLGHYHPLQWDASRMRFIPIKDDALSFEPFWDALGRGGEKIVVFDGNALPIAPDAQGLQIVNWNAQCNFAARSNRPDVLRHVQRTFGHKPIGDEIAVWKSRRTLAKVRDRLIKSARLKTDAILWAMREFDWTCFITAYYEGHRAGHCLWPIWEDYSSDPPEDAMLDVFREIDFQLGRILSALDLSQTTFILLSMHGMTPDRAQDHFLPEVIARINRLYCARQNLPLPPTGVGGIARYLRQTVPPAVQMRVRELVGQRAQDWLVDREWRGGKNWKATPALPVPGSGDVGFVRLNILGRERDGFLQGGDAVSAYTEFLRKQLLALRVKETGEHLIENFSFSRDEFPGRCAHVLPDVLLTWRPDRPATEIYSPELGTIKAVLKTGRGGSHTGDSFALIAGATGSFGELTPLSHVRDYKTFVDQFFGHA